MKHSLAIFPPVTLVFDKEVSGHHLDYVQFLVEFLKTKNEKIRNSYVFVLNEAAALRFKKDEPLVRFHYLSDHWVTQNAALPVLKKAELDLTLLRDLAVQYKAQRLLLMQIDAYQFELGRVLLENAGFKVWGILFAPFHRQYEDGSTPVKWLKLLLRAGRKMGQMTWLLRNPNVEKLFFLNHKAAVQTHKNYFGERFEYLPDPINNGIVIDESVETLKEKYKIPQNRRVLLIYGHLSPRKNIPNIMASLAYLSAEQKSQICIFVCGEAEEGYEQVLKTAIETAEKTQSKVAFVKNFHFFDAQSTHEVIKLSDVVLVPYLHFFSSSNILGLAAKYDKPLISTQLGIMGELVRQYQLGVGVDAANCQDIAAAIGQGLQDKFLAIDGSNYLRDHATEVFCQKLLGL